MSRGCISQVAVFLTKDRTWSMKSENKVVPWKTRADHAAAVSPDGRWLLIFGGQHAGEGGNWNRLQDTWRVSLPEAHPSNWVQLGDLAAARSSPSCMTLSTGWVLTLGGHYTPDTETVEVRQDDVEGMKTHHDKTEFKTYNDVLALDLSGGGTMWKTMETVAPWPARDDAAASMSADGSLLIFGGGRSYGGGNYLQDVWRLANVSEKYGLFASPAVSSSAQRNEL